MLVHKDPGRLDPVRGGYSDQRLWPWYMLISGAALFLIPVVGVFWGLLTVGLPTFWIMRKVAKMQERNPRAVDIAWKRINDLYKELEFR